MILPVEVESLFTVSIEKKEGEKFFFKALASTSDIDLTGDIVTDQALAASEDDLLQNSTIFLDHDRKRPIGRVTGTEFQPEKGLEFVGLIDPTEEEIQSKIKSGTLSKVSIGAVVMNADKVTDEKTGKKVTRILRMKLKEVSLVSAPANPEARTLSWWIAKSEQESKRKELGSDPTSTGLVETGSKGGGETKMSDATEVTEVETNVIEAPEPEMELEEVDLNKELKTIEDKATEEMERDKQQKVRANQIKAMADRLIKGAPAAQVPEIGRLIKALVDRMLGSESPYPYPSARLNEEMAQKVDRVIELLEKQPETRKSEPAPKKEPEDRQVRVVRKGEGKATPQGDTEKDQVKSLEKEIEEAPKKGTDGIGVLAGKGALFLKPR